MEEKSQLWFAIYSSFFLVQARRRKGKEEKKREEIKVWKLSQAILVYGLLGKK